MFQKVSVKLVLLQREREYVVEQFVVWTFDVNKLAFGDLSQTYGYVWSTRFMYCFSRLIFSFQNNNH